MKIKDCKNNAVHTFFHKMSINISYSNGRSIVEININLACNSQNKKNKRMALIQIFCYILE